MKIIPLGGAEEVGATCTLVEIGGHKILVDAGIRINNPDPLPDLGRISDFGGIEAILITHAHTDHTGALPVVHRAYPAVPIFATPGTQAIMNVLFTDALNIMRSRYEVDREIPLYSKELVDSLFTRVQAVQLGQSIKLCSGDISATFFPAGHILGAACIGLQSVSGESIFISGDISVTPQLTVSGMLSPVAVDRKFKAQVVMVESTYGNRMHANRAAEERRLLETVAGVVERGGRVLIPAFAVGRAQEVLLILANAMARKAIAPFPVWADGMVRSVCGVYTQHPYDLANVVRRQIVKNGNPFFGDNVGSKDSAFSAITTSEDRTRMAEAKVAGCIVASSGMLSGGPSSFYARYLAREADSAIFITGYQDEESPGRALLELAEATNPADRVLKLDGEAITVACQIGKYSLSAHVDAGEIAGLIDQLNPQETILVHGAGGAREALSELLIQTKDRKIYLPSAGDELSFEPRGKKRRPKNAAQTQPDPLAQPSTEVSGEGGTAEDETKSEEVKEEEVKEEETKEEEKIERPALPGSAEELEGVRAKIAERWGKSTIGRTFTVQELAQVWLETSGGAKEWPGGINADEYGHLRELFNQKESGFVPDPRRPFLYRLKRDGIGGGGVKGSGGKKSGKKNSKNVPTDGSGLPLEQNAALAQVEKLLPPSTGLYRRGAMVAERKLVLYFNFPEPARQKHSDTLAELTKLTGWTVELNGETHQGALIETLRQLLPPTLCLLKTPGIFREVREIRAVLEYKATEGTSQAEELARLCAAFTVETGWNLQATFESGQESITLVMDKSAAANPKQPRLEINAAFNLIERTFSKSGVELLRKSLKTGAEGNQFIELSFVTSQIGEQHQATIKELEEQVGWSIRINPEPHQQSLQRMGEQILREADISKYSIKAWSIYRDKKELGVKLEKLEKEPDKEAIQARFHALTGWNLKF
ncbi:MAG: MBL fold metallo-hydrolase [Chloroflexota bacterium]